MWVPSPSSVRSDPQWRDRSYIGRRDAIMEYRNNPTAARYVDINYVKSRLPDQYSTEEIIEMLPDDSYSNPQKYYWAVVAEQMSIHVDGTYPYELIENRRPFEDDSRWHFRRNNYEPITVASVMEAINGLHRIFNPRNYEIKASPELLEYINRDIFKGGNYMAFVREIALINMIRDPNGVIVIMPYGAGLYSVNEKIEPRPIIVDSYMIVSKTTDHLIWLSEERTYIDTGGGKRDKCGLVYYIYTQYTLERLYQTGARSKVVFERELVYRHDIGEVPYINLGGIWRHDGNYFESFFRGFIPFGNECIRQYSDWQGTMITCAYPIREMKRIRCSAEGCIDGHVWSDNRSSSHRCGTCNGTGYVFGMSPYGVFEMEEWNEGMMNGTDTRPPIKYHAPDTKIIEYSETAWRSLYMDARKSLHLEHVDEAQAGIAKAIDRDREYSMLLEISNTIFDNHIMRGLQYIDKMRFGGSFDDIAVVKPTEFKLYTERDLLDILAELKIKQAPLAIQTEVTREIIRKRHLSNPKEMSIQMALLEMDPLYFYTMEEKIQLQATGVFDVNQVRLSMYAPAITDELGRKFSGPEYIDKTLDIDWIKKEIQIIYDEKYRVDTPTEKEFKPISESYNEYKAINNENNLAKQAISDNTPNEKSESKKNIQRLDL